METISWNENWVNHKNSFLDWTTTKRYVDYGGYVEKASVETTSSGRTKSGTTATPINKEYYSKAWSTSSSSGSMTDTWPNNNVYIYCNDSTGVGVSQGLFSFNFVWYAPREPYVETEEDSAVGWGGIGSL